jgi:hypothetical protein
MGLFTENKAPIYREADSASEGRAQHLKRLNVFPQLRNGNTNHT